MAFKMKGYSAFNMKTESNKNSEDKKDYTPPSPREQIRLAKIASEKSGKDLRYDARLSKIDGAHRFV